MKHKTSVNPVIAFFLISMIAVVILFSFRSQFSFQDQQTTNWGNISTPTPVPGPDKMTLTDVKKVDTLTGSTLIIQNWKLSVNTGKKTTFSFQYLPLEVNKKMIMTNTLSLSKKINDSTDFELYNIEITAIDSKYDTFENIKMSKTQLVTKKYGNNYPICFEKETTTYEGTINNTCFYQGSNDGYFIVSTNFLSRMDARIEVESILSNIKITK